MREMLKHATVEDLKKLLKTAMAAETEDGNEADLMISIVDELMERGEVKRSTKAELEQGFADLMCRVEAYEKDAATHNAKSQPSWHERLLQDVAKDREIRRKKQRKFVRLTVALTVMILLVNTITVNVSGFNFLGDFFRWTGQVVYQFLGGTPALEIDLIHGEMQALQDELDQRGINIMLPQAIIRGYNCSGTQVTLEEPFCATAWFSDFSTGKEFSILINGIPDGVMGTPSESNSGNPGSTFQHGGIVYSVFTNFDRLSIVWNDSEYQLILQGNLTYDEAKAIIESIERDVAK